MSDNIKVFMPELIDASLLYEHPGNTQRQSKHEFAELRESIRTNGFDETLLVRKTETGYEVVSGNHRYRAGRAEGMEAFPCVIRDDWDDFKVEIESVRRNYVRGKIDKTAFTNMVNRLVDERSLPIEVISEQLGFEDAHAFEKLYEQQREQEANEVAVAEATSNPAAVKLIDNLGLVLSDIFATYGHTVPHSFMIFPAAGKFHMYIAANQGLRSILTAVGEQCVAQGVDINIALSGLLQIGAAHSAFLQGTGGNAVIEAAGEVSESGTSEDAPLLPVSGRRPS